MGKSRKKMRKVRNHSNFTFENISEKESSGDDDRECH